MSAPYVFRGIELPAHLKKSIDAFVEEGVPCGDFLRWVLDNNLHMAWTYADDESWATLSAILGYLFNECPMVCWGHANSHDSWCERKRVEREMEAAK